MMTRLDFLRLSAALKKAKPRERSDKHGYQTPTSEAETGGWQAATLSIANSLSGLPTFNRARFLKDSGMEV